MRNTDMSTSGVYKRGRGVSSSPNGSERPMGVISRASFDFWRVCRVISAGELFPLCHTKEQTRVFEPISQILGYNGPISTPHTLIPTVGLWTIARIVIQSRAETDSLQQTGVNIAKNARI